MKTITCQKPPIQPTVLDSKPKAFVRRLIQKFAPIHARVRYDATKNLWAILDDSNQPIRHFRNGFMENVQLSHVHVKIGSGCGASSEYIGIASGTLREGIYSPNLVGLTNLSFKQGFIDEQGNSLSSCSQLQLMPERRALYLK